MKIKDIGGEQALIRRISKKVNDKNVLVGIGDDAAVIRTGKKKLVITTDMLVEDDHFSMDYFSPFEIGLKAIEANVSDIAAMGARPKYALISLALTKNSSVEFVEQMYRGFYSSCKKNGIEIIGGDTTHGKQVVVNVTILGEAGKNIPLRSSAKPGDFIFVTGDLGASTAGLFLFRKKIRGFEKVKRAHLRPKAQLVKGLRIASFANACEDVSDGLASEVSNICRESKCGAQIFYEKIPLGEETKKAAKRLGKRPEDFALYGGEDFHLVFTCGKRHRKKAQILGQEVGRIIKGKKIHLNKNGKNYPLTKTGFDHFK